MFRPSKYSSSGRFAQAVSRYFFHASIQAVWSVTGYALTLHQAHPAIDQSAYRGADKSLARPTSRCIMFDGENISFDASLVIYINSTNIPPGPGVA
jgi:hypothetical protein